MTITKNKLIFRFGALLLTFAMLLTLTPLGTLPARAAGEIPPKLLGTVWDWAGTSSGGMVSATSGTVASMTVYSDTVLAESKAMLRHSQWSTNGTSWNTSALTPTTVSNVANGTISGGKIYIYTPISGDADNGATLPNIKADVAVELDPRLKNVGDHFMYEYARGCDLLISLGAPDAHNVTTIGDYFMLSYAKGCTALTNLGVPELSAIKKVGSLFMTEYATDCVSIASLTVPNTDSLTQVGSYFMSQYAYGCKSIISLDAPYTGKITKVPINFMMYYAANCTSIKRLGIPDTTKMTSIDQGFLFEYAKGSNVLTELTVQSAPGIFQSQTILLGIDRNTGKNITVATRSSEEAAAWFALASTEYRSLYVDYIRATTHEIDSTGKKIKPLVDAADPVILSGSIARTSDVAATIGFFAGEAGQAYYLVKGKDEIAPDKLDVAVSGKSLGAVDAGTVTGKPVELTAGAKDIYVVLQNSYGNVSAPLKIVANAFGASAPVLDGAAWNWAAAADGIVATMTVAADATLAESKAMVKNSKWSTDGTSWNASELTPGTVVARRGEKLYIFTPLVASSNVTTAVLPNIKADVTVEMTPGVTVVHDNFLSSYARDCTALTSLGVPDTSGITEIGNSFMAYYARGCTALTSHGVPGTSGVTKIGNSFMAYYAYGCTALTSLDVPDTSGLTTVDDSFMYSYASGCAALTELGVPDTSGITEVGGLFLSGYAEKCKKLTSLGAPDTSRVTTAGNSFLKNYAVDCTNLTSLGVPDTSRIDTTGDGFMAYYADGCTSLTSLGIPDLSAITTAGSDFMHYYIDNCRKLTALNAVSGPGYMAAPDTAQVIWGSEGYLYGPKTTFNAPTTQDITAWFALTDTAREVLYDYSIRAGTHSIAGTSIVPNGAASISPGAVAFNKNTSSAKYADVTVTLTLNGKELTEIKYGGVTLGADTDYTVSGDVYTIGKEYFAVLEDGIYAIIFDMDSGTDPVLTVTVSDFVSDDTAPALSGGSVNRTSDTEATIGFTTDEAGIAYYLVQTGTESYPANTAVRAGTSLGAVSTAAMGKAVTLEAGVQDIYVVIEDAAGNISEVLKITAAEYTVAALTGTATIDNTAPKIGDMLFATLEDSNNTGDLSYQWKFGTGIAGTGSIYTVQTEDLGKTITVEISSTVETGSVTSAATSEVVKKTGPAAPAAPTMSSKSTNSVTLDVVAGCEYSLTVTGDWQTSNVFDDLTANTPYTFYQRIAATADTLPSTASPVLNVITDTAASTVTSVTVSPSTSEVQKGTTQQFSARVIGTNDPAQTVTWEVTGGVAGTAITDGLLTVAADETAESLTITATSTVNTGIYGTAAVTVTDSPPTPIYGVSLNTGGYAFPDALAEDTTAVTPLTVIVTNTGNQPTSELTITLSGDNAGDFSLNTSSISGIAVSGTGSFTVSPKTGLAAGAYTAIVTVSGENDISVSFNVSFTVTAAQGTTYTITFNPTGGTVSQPSATTDTNGRLTTLPTPTRSGYTFSGWFTAAGGGTKIITTTIFSGNDTIYAQWTANGGNTGGGPATPGTPSTNTVGGSDVTTPAGKNPVPNGDGSVTLPGGGTIITGGDKGVTVDAPEGTTVDKNGNVTIPDNKNAELKTPDANISVPGGSQIDSDGKVTVGNGTADVKLPGGTEIKLPEGSVIDGNRVTVGSGGASVTYLSGITLHFDEGEEIILDAGVPLGFFATSELSLTDVPESAWYYDSIAFAYRHKLFMGTGIDTFSPDMPMTRGMLVTVLHRAAGLPNPATGGAFTDVLPGEYFSDAADWAKGVGIASGTGGGLFSPNDNITREQLVTMIAQFARHMGIDTSASGAENTFADSADISNWAADAVAWAQSVGIVSGKPGNVFDPKGQATRAEVAAVLMRFIEMAQ